jgi:hypothetical protein
MASFYIKAREQSKTSKVFLTKIISIGNNILAVFLFEEVLTFRRSFQAAFRYFWALACDF